MYALTEVVSLAHEHSSEEGGTDLIDSVRALLTSDDMERFTNMCEDGGHGCGRDSDLYVMYNQHLVDGRTQFVQVSVGMTTDEQDREDEAIGWGNYEYDMGRTYFRLFHQMSAYVAYLEQRSEQEQDYYDEFLVSYRPILIIPRGPFI